MNAFVVYVLLLKAIGSSFAGMGSLPQIQQDFVETRRAITAEQLSQAVLVGRSTPGPIGAYVVAAWLAGIIFNLLTLSGYYDVALRDFGLLLGALTLGRLSAVYDR